MKTIIKFSGLFILAVLYMQTRGQNYIAVQHGNTLTHYTTLDAAITGAQSGDYVYIPGGVYTLSVNISKKLSIYGAGHYPDSTVVTNETQINSNVKIVTGADNGLLSGVHITGYLQFGTSSANQVVNSYSIQRCKIDGNLNLSYLGTTITTSQNIHISENVIIGSIYGGSASNVLCEKNIIETNIAYFQNGGIFRNNIFLFYSNCGTGVCRTVFGWEYSDLIVNCLFENNIVFDSEPLRSRSGSYPYYTDHFTLNCQFNNNLFIYNQTFPYYTNIGTNNKVNQVQSSIFVNQTGYAFSYSHDYHLKSTSPGKNAGTDGTDIGIYGTGQPYKAGAVPGNPHIRQKNITTQNNQINVNIKVAAQDR